MSKSKLFMRALYLLLPQILAICLIIAGLQLDCRSSATCSDTDFWGGMSQWVGWGGVLLFIFYPLLAAALLLYKRPKETLTRVHRIHAILVVLGFIIIVTADLIWPAPAYLEGDQRQGLFVWWLMFILISYPASWIFLLVNKKVKKTYKRSN